MKTIKYLGMFIIFQFVFLNSSLFAASNYALEIIQPRSGLDINNRFYKAYPGLEYNVRLSVVGGAYPYSFSLVTSPSGMSINSNTGEVTWTNPPASNDPYPVEVRVSDDDNTSVSVNWTITVTENGFRFIDAVNGTSAANGGTGTIDNPWKGIIDMYEGDVYESKRASSYAGEFLYFRSGTYEMDAYLEDEATNLPLVSYYKPLVWLAYPGDTKPRLDMGRGTLTLYAGADNFYLDGFEVTNISNTRRKGIHIESSANNVTFRRNSFHNVTALTGSRNQSAVMIAAAAKGNYWSFQDNEFYDIDHGYGIIGYLANNVLIENNVLHNIRDSLNEGSFHAIGPKESTTYWFIRGNTLYDIQGDAIWLMFSNTRGDSGNIEVSFNNVESSYTSFQLNYAQAQTGGPVYVFRNTFVGGRVQVYNVNDNIGQFSIYNNVISNTDSLDGIMCTSCTNPDRLLKISNVYNSNSSELLNFDNTLTDAYNQYQGTHGHVIGPIIRPKSPTSVTAQ